MRGPIRIAAGQGTMRDVGASAELVSDQSNRRMFTWRLRWRFRVRLSAQNSGPIIARAAFDAWREICLSNGSDLGSAHHGHTPYLYWLDH